MDNGVSFWVKVQASSFFIEYLWVTASVKNLCRVLSRGQKNRILLVSAFLSQSLTYCYPIYYFVISSKGIKVNTFQFSHLWFVLKVFSFKLENWQGFEGFEGRKNIHAKTSYLLQQESYTKLHLMRMWQEKVNYSIGEYVTRKIQSFNRSPKIYRLFAYNLWPRQAIVHRTSLNFGTW